MQLITGRGRSSRMANEGVVRLSVLRFLQVLPKIDLIVHCTTLQVHAKWCNGILALAAQLHQPWRAQDSQGLHEIACKAIMHNNVAQPASTQLLQSILVCTTRASHRQSWQRAMKAW